MRLSTLAIVGLLACAVSSARGQVAASPPAIAVSPTISTLTTGTVLDARAGVSADGRYVTLTVQPSFASLEGFDTFTSGGSSGQAQAAGLTSVPFRPAVVGAVTVIEKDKTLLAKTVKPATLKDLSLKAAMRKLAAASNTNIVLGFRGFQQAGIDVDAPHTFTLGTTGGGTLKDALLDMLKTAAPQQDMVVTADEGVVQIATQAQADNAVVTRSYNLEDLLANLPRIVPPTMDLGTLKNNAPTPGKAPTAKPVAARTAARDGATDVLRLIAASVRPEIWKINGGKVGELAIVGDRVIVTAPQSVQAILDGPRRASRGGSPMYVGVSQ